MYVLAENDKVIKYPYSLRELKEANPSVSFPSHFTDELLADYGVFFVSVAAQPEFDIHTQKCVNDDAPTYVDGSWVLYSSISDKTQEEKDQIFNEYASMNREQRDMLLAKCDWTQLSDAPLTDTQKQSWSVYRQALRDISEQAGFPFSIEWPSHAG